MNEIFAAIMLVLLLDLVAEMREELEARDWKLSLIIRAWAVFCGVLFFLFLERIFK